MSTIFLQAFDKQTLIAELSQLGQTEFAKKYACGFLSIRPIPRLEQSQVHIITLPAEGHLKNQPKIPAEYFSYPQGSRILVPIIKSNRNSHSGITLGRAPNNDLVVLAGNISKIHCVFQKTLEPGCSLPNCSLMDMRSANGTFVNDHRIEPRIPVNLKSDDRVMLWQIKCIYLSLECFLKH